MLDGNDKGTFYALRLLRDVVDSGGKPIIIWAGAGVSRWCGFPSWEETAEHFHKNYRRLEPAYAKAEGQQLLQAGRFPELFEALRLTNQQRYNRELASLFASRTLTPVYRRFIGIVNQITPLQIVTTNIDDSLERNLRDVATVQKSDIERCLHLANAKAPFVAKLHGSVSAIESTVFSSRDYQSLLEIPGYLRTLEILFAQSTVVFVGYSLRDKYVLDLFAANSKARPLFGDGPHFLVQSGESPALPDSIKTIRYLSEPHTDHRSAITVIDIVRLVKQKGHLWFSPEDERPPAEKRFASAYFISDLTLPGTWTSSQSLVLGAGPDRPDFTPNAIIGQGFENSELPDTISHAMHDLAVGLISFDLLYFPFSCAAKLHDLLGSPAFWDMVNAGVFRFIYFEQEPVVMFPSLEAVDGGDIGTMGLSAEGGRPLTIDEQIRKQFHGVPGQEREAERLFETLRNFVSSFDHARFNIPSLTRGALLHPSVRRLLGISDAVLPTSFPRWVRFPVIRLAHTIMAGCACENFALPATKIGFGSAVLVGAAFTASAARDWADSVSSYVLAGRFNTDLGAYVESNPSALRAILAFRDTEAGIALRCQVLEELATTGGSDFVASVNAGLRSMVPSGVMESSRNQLSGLLIRSRQNSTVVPAVWTTPKTPIRSQLYGEQEAGRNLRNTVDRGVSKNGTHALVAQAKLSDHAAATHCVSEDRTDRVAALTSNSLHHANNRLQRFS